MTNKKDEKNNWKTTDNRFVAFLDILGFKDFIMRKSHAEMFNILNEISNTKKAIENDRNLGFPPVNFGDAEVYIVSFSDSIIIFSNNDNPRNFAYFLLSTRLLFASAFNKQIPLKGAIAHGKISLHKTKQIYFGQPIIDAYLMEEDVNYLGIVAHNSIDNYISSIKDEKILKVFDTLLFEEKTPLKCGILTHTNLNWFKMIKTEDSNNNYSENMKSRINLFKNSTSGSARKYIDNTISILEKIENTLNN